MPKLVCSQCKHRRYRQQQNDALYQERYPLCTKRGPGALLDPDPPCGLAAVSLPVAHATCSVTTRRPYTIHDKGSSTSAPIPSTSSSTNHIAAATCRGPACCGLACCSRGCGPSLCPPTSCSPPASGRPPALER